jgi:hypothetical protein
MTDDKVLCLYMQHNGTSSILVKIDSILNGGKDKK